MALSKKSITGLGTLMSVAVIAVSGFLVIKPAYEQAQTNNQEYSNLQIETSTKNARLSTLEEGVENYDEIQAYVDDFLVKAPSYKDVESASRAISTAVVPGITINSFNFGNEAPTSDYTVPKASLDAQPETTNLEDSGSSNSEENAETASSAGSFQRIPIQIQVTANDYTNLSEYVDNLSKQDRLLTIVSITSAGDGEGITATIDGYAFIYTR